MTRTGITCIGVLVVSFVAAGCRRDDSPPKSADDYGLKVSVESDTWRAWLNVEVTGKCVRLGGNRQVISWTNLWFRPKPGQEERGPDLYGRPGRGLVDLSGTFRPGTYEVKGKLRLRRTEEPVVFAKTVRIPS